MQLRYGDEESSIPIDVIVYDKERATLRTYNVKRGNGAYDAGKRRIILSELLRVNMLLQSYAGSIGLVATAAEAKIIFYYGLRSIAEPLSLVREELDKHFDFPVVAALEEVNNYFREKLHWLIEHE